MQLLLAAWLLASQAQPMVIDRYAVLEVYDDEDPEEWGLRDWDHEA